MNRASHPTAGRSWIACSARCTIVIPLLLIPPAVLAQSDQTDSLVDAARQARAQRQAHENTGSSQAQQVADELSGDQNDGGAPEGFKTYKAGDYWLLLPFPYRLEGQENGSAVLMASPPGGASTEVLAGNPVPVPANLSDNDLLNRVQELAGRQGSDPSCSAIQLGSHKAFRCSFSGSLHLLGREVSGTMEVVATSNSLIPVLCDRPTQSQCGPNDFPADHACAGQNPGSNAIPASNAGSETRAGNEKNTAQICDEIVYPSVQLKEDLVGHAATIVDRTLATNPAVTIPQDTVAVAGEQSVSLGELARQTRKAVSDQAQAQADHPDAAVVVPPGFQSFSVQFCLRPESCGEALVVIPEKSEITSHVNGQYIFKTTQDGSLVMLYAGPADVNAPYRSMTDPDFIRMRDLANANASSHEKTDGVSTQEMTIEGLSAFTTRFRYQRDQNTWWIGERTLIDKDGAPFLLGCTASEEHAAAADTLCTTLVNSLRFP